MCESHRAFVVGRAAPCPQLGGAPTIVTRLSSALPALAGAFALLLCGGVVLAGDKTFKDPWRDRSPHREGFVNAGGVRLHYLDWGGRGPALVFLTGLGHSAHVYDTFAPAFADRFRVLGLTRRGHGRSDKPPDAYAAATLAEDLRRFLDALQIRRASFVGHSMAAAEMTRFATLYPERVDKLVYLDAAFDYSAEWHAVNSSAPPERPPTSEQLSSLRGFREFTRQAKCGWSEAWEADMRQTIIFSPAGRPLRAAMPDEVRQALLKGLLESRPDYSKVRAPALSFVVMGRFPACSFAADPDAAARRKIREFNERMVAYRRGQIESFKRAVPGGRVVEVMDDDHYFFLQRKRGRVIRQIRAFLSTVGRRPARARPISDERFGYANSITRRLRAGWNSRPRRRPSPARRLL